MDKRKLPVLVHYMEPETKEGHYAVVVGHEAGDLLLNDPWQGPLYQPTRNEFLKHWHDEANEYPRWMLVASHEPIPQGRQFHPD